VLRIRFSPSAREMVPFKIEVCLRVSTRSLGGTKFLGADGETLDRFQWKQSRSSLSLPPAKLRLSGSQNGEPLSSNNDEARERRVKASHTHFPVESLPVTIDLEVD